MPKLNKKNWQWLVSIYLLWRGWLLLISFLADKFLPYTPTFPYAHYLLPLYNLPRFFYSWANFDGVHYLTIAENGYFGIGSVQAFFPLWPILIRFLSLLLSNSLVAGLVLNTIFSFLLLVSWFLLVREIFARAKQRTIKLLTLGLLLFPTSFYFTAIYSESLFLLLIICSFLLANRKKWWLSAFAIGLASGLRVVGIIGAIIPSVMYIKDQYPNWSWRKSLMTLALLAISATGFIVYALYLNWRFHDWLYFLHVQSEFGAGRQSELITYFQSWWRATKILIFARPFNLKYWSYIQDWLAGTAGLALIISAFKSKIPKVLTIFSLLAFLVPSATGSFLSMPRYILVLPSLLLVWSGFFSGQGWKLYLKIIIATILLSFNTLLFIQGFWVA